VPDKTPTTTTGAASSGRSALWRYAPLALIVLAMAAVFGTGSHRYFSLETLLEHRERLQVFVEEHRNKALILYMLVYITVVTLSIPVGVFLTILGGFLFGWLVGGAAAAISATIGGVGIFLVARTSFGDVLLRRAGDRIQRLADGFRQDAFSYLLFVRFVPIIPFWLTNLASALFGVKLRTFALATMIGVIPATYAFAVAGSGLDSIIEKQQAARDACLAAGNTDCGLDLGLRTLITPQILVAFVALGILALTPIILRRFFGDRIKWLRSDNGEAKR
jgi:uncharacterized membrane protein YdjX (TVP38/TMEM64 family)